MDGPSSVLKVDKEEELNRNVCFTIAFTGFLWDTWWFQLNSFGCNETMHFKFHIAFLSLSQSESRVSVRELVLPSDSPSQIISTEVVMNGPISISCLTGNDSTCKRKKSYFLITQWNVGITCNLSLITYILININFTITGLIHALLLFINIVQMP